MTSSSSESGEEPPDRPKFTRGEKCIFIHTVVTFCLILLLVLIYFVHLCVVKHSLRDVLKVSRRTATKDNSVEVASLPIGVVQLHGENVLAVCNSLLLSERWSVAPGHCVAMRTDPDMHYLLFLWCIKYSSKENGFLVLRKPVSVVRSISPCDLTTDTRGPFTDRFFIYAESKIKRTIPHPHFDRGDFGNNVGLIEHEEPIRRTYFTFTSGLELSDDTLQSQASNLTLVGWVHNDFQQGDVLPTLQRFEVSSVPTEKCILFMEPVIDLRVYEHCVLLQERSEKNVPDHGSAFIVDSRILGFFGWGEKSGIGAPCIVLDIWQFKDWINNIIAW